MLNLDEIDPGIRRTVQWLNERGWKTTDSGDGSSKIGTEAEDCMEVIPNVTIVLDNPSDLVFEAHHLLDALVEHGLDPEATILVDGQEMPVWQIEALYLPGPKVAILQLVGVTDANMFK